MADQIRNPERQQMASDGKGGNPKSERRQIGAQIKQDTNPMRLNTPTKN